MLCSKDSCMPVSTDSVQKENRVREENFVKALVCMRNTQEFDDYCFEQGISVEQQAEWLERHGKKVTSADLFTKLTDKKCQIENYLGKYRREKITDEYEKDSGSREKSFREPKNGDFEPLETYFRTPYGVQLGKDYWNNLIDNMVSNGYLRKEDKERAKVMFGVSQRLQNGEVLKEPLELNISVISLAKLIAMMYGSITYDTCYDVRVGHTCKEMIHYRFNPLIRIANGSGINEKGKTNDAFWEVLSRMVRTKKGGVHSKETFRAAASKKVKDNIMVPLIKLLGPQAVMTQEKR